jgi:hypothetical protein
MKHLKPRPPISQRPKRGGSASTSRLSNPQIFFIGLLQRLQQNNPSHPTAKRQRPSNPSNPISKILLINSFFHRDENLFAKPDKPNLANRTDPSYFLRPRKPSISQNVSKNFARNSTMQHTNTNYSVDSSGRAKGMLSRSQKQVQKSINYNLLGGFENRKNDSKRGSGRSIPIDLGQGHSMNDGH